jgi:beta-lactamase class A
MPAPYTAFLARLRRLRGLLILVATVLTLTACKRVAEKPKPGFDALVLDYQTPTDPTLQTQLEAIDANLRERHGMSTDHTAAGLLDLRASRIAMVHPDRITYGASVPKIGILLAYFQLHPEAATQLPPPIRHELGLMAKASSNEMAAKFSRELGLAQIQHVLDRYGFYSAERGGGIWVGRHYGKSDERIGDPVANHSHAATVRQLLRFYLLLEQGKLVSSEASREMRKIFASPSIPHDNIKFVKALDDRPDVQIIRKWGSWENWLHDTAVITAPNRHYILVGLTEHPKGDDYLVDLARAADDLMSASAAK